MEGSGICSAAFCESAALRRKRARPLRQFASLTATSPKGRGSGETGSFALEPGSVPPCQGLPPFGGAGALAPERARTFAGNKLPQSKPDGFASSLGEGASGASGHFAL